jgi:hypothetical protein
MSADDVLRFYQLPTEEVAFTRRVNPMCEVFPRVASCTYWKYGTGGHPVGLQALCILSLNIVIDKVGGHKQYYNCNTSVVVG